MRSVDVCQFFDIENRFCLNINLFLRFVLWVAGEDVVTDITVNDGDWHHVTVTWSQTDGEWSVFLDGETTDTGKGLAEGAVIEGTLW